MPIYNFLGVEIWLPSLSDLIDFITTPVQDLVSSLIADTLVKVAEHFGVTDDLIKDVFPSLSGFLLDNTHPILGGLDLHIGDTKAGVDLIPGNILGEHEGTRGVVASGDAQLGLMTAMEGALTRTETGLQVQGAQTALGSLFDGGVKDVRDDIETMDTGIAGEMSTRFSGFGVTDVAAAYGGVDSLRAVLGSDLAVLTRASSPITLKDAAERAELAIKVNQTAWTMFNLITIAAEVGSLGQVDIGVAQLMHRPKEDAWYKLATDLEYLRYDVGIKRTWEYELNRRWQASIPVYADLIRIYVKEAYLPEKWAELPPEMAEYFKWLGYSEFWTQRLWGAHWVLVPLGQLYEMFHRGLITKEELTTQIKYHDYELVWRDRLIEIAYSLIGRIDLRRGWEAGLISDADLVTRYEYLGYSPGDAVLMADLHKRFALAAEYSAMSRQSETDFIEGFIDEATHRANIAALGFHPQVVDMRVAAAKLRAEREYKKEERALLMDLYNKDLITDAALAAALTKLGYQQTWVTIFVDRAKIKKARVTRLETAALAKPLTLTMVTRAWTKGLISEPQAVERLMMLGYSEPDSRLILDVYREEETD